MSPIVNFQLRNMGELMATYSTVVIVPNNLLSGNSMKVSILVIFTKEKYNDSTFICSCCIFLHFFSLMS